jgi:hypothetical protein
MAKTTISIEQKMARLEVYKDVLEHIDNQIDWKQRDAEDYLRQAKETAPEGEEINKDSYSYRQYEANTRLVEAYKQLQEDLLAEA